MEKQNKKKTGSLSGQVLGRLPGPSLVARGRCLAAGESFSVRAGTSGGHPGLVLLPLQILSLTHHLFPRTTVQPILRSETGRLTQETLEKTLQSPPEPTILADDTWCDSSR